MSTVCIFFFLTLCVQDFIAFFILLSCAERAERDAIACPSLHPWEENEIWWWTQETTLVSLFCVCWLSTILKPLQKKLLVCLKQLACLTFPLFLFHLWLQERLSEVLSGDAVKRRAESSAHERAHGWNRRPLAAAHSEREGPLQKAGRRETEAVQSAVRAVACGTYLYCYLTCSTRSNILQQ